MGVTRKVFGYWRYRRLGDAGEGGERSAQTSLIMVIWVLYLWSLDVHYKNMLKPRNNIKEEKVMENFKKLKGTVG